MVELTTQLLILANILWLPLCRIKKFGLNTLPSKAVVIPYTCGLIHQQRIYNFWLFHVVILSFLDVLQSFYSNFISFFGTNLLITHKYRGSQQFLRVEYSTQIYRFDTRGAKEYLQVLATELSIQSHLEINYLQQSDQ